MLRGLARLRVPLGFACAVVAFWLARPTQGSLVAGIAIALVGQGLRIWASGHIEKGREVTRSGPYRWVRHPLYVGSAIMAAGFLVAARDVAVAAVVATYMIFTLLAAIRTEEQVLEDRFGSEYSAYRAGTAPPVDRPFSLARARGNREYRAVIGTLVGFAILFWKS
jgi:protein-S-isoprenylcysteine O-methyltransferase Ste14